MKNEIRKELILPAPPQEVWAKSFGSAEALATWFLPLKDGKFEPGQVLTFDCGEDIAQALILEIDPPAKLVWKGHPGGAYKLTDFPESEMTTDTFLLEPHPTGTKLIIIESGFAKIPSPRGTNAFEGNESGWDSLLPRFIELFSDDPN